MSSISHRQELVDELAAKGHLTDPAWRAAVAACAPRTLPRGHRLPAQGHPVGSLSAATCSAMTSSATAFASSDSTWVTQVEGTSAENGGGQGGLSSQSAEADAFQPEVEQFLVAGDLDPLLRTGRRR